MAKASAQPQRPEWEQLPDSGQRIYLALAEGDLERARQLYQGDQRPRSRPRRRAGGGAKPTGAKATGAKTTNATGAKATGAKATGAKATGAKTTKATGAKATGAKTTKATGAKATGAKATVAARRPTRDLRGFVASGDRLEPPEMAAAEAWKRRQARRDSASV
jgi:hypothetical protein